MSGIPVLDVFERNREGLSGSVCMLGAPDQVLAADEDAIHSLTTHFGQWEHHGGHDQQWYFGYDDPALPAVSLIMWSFSCPRPEANSPCVVNGR